MISPFISKRKYSSREKPPHVPTTKSKTQGHEPTFSPPFLQQRSRATSRAPGLTSTCSGTCSIYSPLSSVALSLPAPSHQYLNVKFFCLKGKKISNSTCASSFLLPPSSLPNHLKMLPAMTALLPQLLLPTCTWDSAPTRALKPLLIRSQMTSVQIRADCAGLTLLCSSAAFPGNAPLLAALSPLGFHSHMLSRVPSHLTRPTASQSFCFVFWQVPPHLPDQESLLFLWVESKALYLHILTRPFYPLPQLQLTTNAGETLISSTQTSLLGSRIMNPIHHCHLAEGHLKCSPSHIPIHPLESSVSPPLLHTGIT